MKKLFTLLFTCFCAGAFAQITDVRINEMDPDQPGGIGSDTLEFIELYGSPGLALDGLVLVFFNGVSAGNPAYASYDLSGYSLDQNGFFVIGSPIVPNVDAFLLSAADAIQNGADGIGLYAGTGADWPSGTPASTTNLIDAIVYGTNDAEDTDLIAVLTPGQAQLNDITNSYTSLARVPDGGLPSDLTSYFSQAPTPGYSNQPSCSGADVIVQSGIIDQCTDSTYMPLSISTTSLFGDNYVYVLTDTSNLILESNALGLFDMNTYGGGHFNIYGVSYNGTLDGSGLTPGNAVDSLSATDCLSLSVNHIVVIRNNCSSNSCDAGVVSLDSGSSYISYCQTDSPGLLNFTHSQADSTSQYRYFLTDANDLIYQEISGSSYNVNTLPVGEYHLYGVAFLGNLAALTVQPGDAITDVQSDGACIAISSNYIDIRNIDCVLGEGCAKVIISEYVEGTSANKAIELYNATPFPVDLADYDLFSYTNGDTSFIVLDTPEGVLQPGQTYVVCSLQADSAILAVANNSTASMTNFNGNDAIVLTYNLEAIDIIGVIGDTVNQWNFGQASTRDHTLRRKFEVTAPTTNWELSAGQWDVFSVNDFSGLGSHSAQICTQQPYLSFAQTAIQINEGTSLFSIEVNAYNIVGQTPVMIDMIQGTATEGVDFTNVFPMQYIFTPDNTVWNVVIEIVDDTEEEVTETFTLTLIEASGQAVFVNEFISVSILDNDQSYPMYPIADVTSQNGLGVLDSINTYCTLAGVVHGINFNPNGLEFTLIDPTDGIRVFSPSNNLGYTVAEGDSVVVLGRIDQFMGMAEILPDSIIYINGGHALETPTAVQSLGEDNESHMVVLQCVTLVDPSQWVPQGSGFEVDVTDGTNTNTMRIDFNTDIYNAPAPEGHFTVVGIGAQMDQTSPYNLGYMFYPRYIADYSNSVVSSFTMPQTLYYASTGANINFTNTGDAGSYVWDFGDNSTSTLISPQHDYAYDFLSVSPTVTISLSTTINGCTDVTSTTVDAVLINGIEEVQSSFVMYPNPTESQLQVISSVAANNWTMYDATGRKVAASNNNLMNNITIDVSDLDAGTYFLQLNSENNQEIKSFVKQ